jgi:hypothetical protein
LYKKTALSETELEDIRSTLAIKGVLVRRINPKAISQDELFGKLEKLSNEFKEGIFTHEFRLLSEIEDDKKKWIHFDGPLDVEWVENLNSVLDDSKKYDLPSGEQIPMAKGMALLFESNNMRNITPATVSRCGLICLRTTESCDPKGIFNHWLRHLPPNL